MTFCWLPPDSVDASTSIDGVRTSNSSTSLLGVALASPAVDDDARGEGLGVDTVQHQVVLDRERADQAVALAVLGHVGQAEREQVLGWRPVTSSPSSRPCPAVDAAHAGDAPRPARSGRCPGRRRSPGSRRPHLEADAVDDAVPAVVDAPSGRRPRARRRPASRGLLVDHRAAPSRPTIIVASCLLVGLLGVGRADDLAAPQHGDPVGDRQHLAELVGDEDDRPPVALSVCDDLEQLVDLVWA